MKPHRGSVILVLGILSLVVCGPLGIFAWIMGRSDLKEMDAGMMDPAGRDNTNAGLICGMIASILMLIGLVVGILLLILFMLGLMGAVAAGHH